MPLCRALDLRHLAKNRLIMRSATIHCSQYMPTLSVVQHLKNKDMGQMKVWIKYNDYFAKVCVPLDADIDDLKRAAKLEFTNTSKDFDITMVQFYLPDANATDPLDVAAPVFPFYDEKGVGKTNKTPFILKANNPPRSTANLTTSNTGIIMLLLLLLYTYYFVIILYYIDITLLVLLH
jgi:hypothetical protein